MNHLFFEIRNILQQKINSILLPSLNNFGWQNIDIDDTSMTIALYRSLQVSRMCTFFYDKTSSTCSKFYTNFPSMLLTTSQYWDVLWIFVTDRNGLCWSLHWSLYWASAMQLEHMKIDFHFLMTTKTAAVNLIRFRNSWIFVTDKNGLLHWLLYCNKSSIWKESHQHLETPRRELIDHARTQRNSKRIINSRFRTLLQKCSTTTCPPY